MKKILQFSFVAMLAIGTAMLFAACEKDDGHSHQDHGGDHGGDRTLSFKKADISGATALALATRTGNTKDASTVSTLYKMNADGSIESVTYNIEVTNENDSVIATVQRTVVLNIQKMVSIGDKWLWLNGCNYICPSLDDIENDTIRGEIQHLLNNNNYARNYLVRTTDGALFEWTEDQGCPTHVWIELRCPDHLRANGAAEPYGNDMLTISNSRVMMRLHDQGNTLQVSTVTPTTVRTKNVLPSDGSFVGARINYSNNSDADGELYVVLPDAAQVLPLTVAPVPEGYSLEEIYSNDGHQNPFMVTVDGQLFLGRTLNGNSGNPGMLQFLRVEVNGGTAQATQVAASWIDDEEVESHEWTGWNPDQEHPLRDRVYHTPTMQWLARRTSEAYNTRFFMYTFNPAQGTVTYRMLPDEYPNDINHYYNNVGYGLPQINGTLPTHYWRCDLSAEAAEQVPLVWNTAELQPWQSQMVMSTLEFHTDAFSQTITGFCRLLDGRSLGFYGELEGANRGHMHVLLDGQQTAGQVISTMVRLN